MKKMNTVSIPAALLAVLGTFGGLADTLPAPVDGVLTIDVSSDVEYTSAIPGGVAKLVKKGVGTATLAVSNAGFTGAVEVQQGTLAGCVKETTTGTGYGYTRSFGDPSSITITAGATLCFLDKGTTEVTPASPRTHYFSGPLTVGGSGVGGLGAVRCATTVNKDVSMHYVWKNVTLTSATTLDATRRWGFGGGTFDMGGYDLTLVGGNIFELGRSMQNTCVNPGDIHIRGNTSLLWESINSFKMPTGYQIGDKTCHLSDGGCVRHFTTTYGNAKFPWAVVASGDAKIMGYYYGGEAADWEFNHLWPLDYYGYFHTPIVMTSADTELKADFYTGAKCDVLNFGAGVTGPGRLVVGVDQWRLGQTVLRGGVSTIGALKLNAGRLIVMNGATLSVTNRPVNNQWNEPTGEDSARSPVRIGGTQYAGSAPRLVVENGGVFKTHFAVGPNDSGNLSTNDAIVMVGHAAGSYGILEIHEGATVSNVLYVGQSGQGAVYMRGGDVFLKTKKLGNVGIGGYGAFVMDGGRLTTNAKLEIGTSARGIFIQRGGVLNHATEGDLSNSFSGQFSLARANADSYGCYYNCGGTLNAPKSQLWLMKHNSLVNGNGTEAFFTLDGPNARAQFRQAKSMVQTSSVKYGAITLRNGGELSVDRMFRDNFIQECGKDAVQTWAAIKDSAFTSRFHLVFDGGVLRTTKAGEFFSYEKLDGTGAEGADATRLPERVLVYEKGATIDTAGNDVVFRAPLAAPQGKGLDAVTIPDGTLTNVNYFIGPRRVIVTDASNNKLVAGAVVDFNVTNRQQRAVIVTHPGENLPDDVKVRVENVTNNGWTDLTVANGGVALRTLASGGLTKRGGGRLTLVGANTYGGKTRVEAGALEFLDVNGYPGGDLEFAPDAVTNAAAAVVTAPRLAFRSGAKLRVTGADELVPDCVRGVKTLVRTTEPLAALPAIEWTDAEGTPVAMPAAWTVRLGAGGRSIDFSYCRGTMVIFR